MRKKLLILMVVIGCFLLPGSCSVVDSPDSHCANNTTYEADCSF